MPVRVGNNGIAQPDRRRLAIERNTCRVRRVFVFDRNVARQMTPCGEPNGENFVGIDVEFLRSHVTNKSVDCACVPPP